MGACLEMWRGALARTQGMTTREVVTTFKAMYDADVSASLISTVTDAVLEQVVERRHEYWMLFIRLFTWIVYLNCIVVKIRQDKWVINKRPGLGVNMEGHKALLGLWHGKRGVRRSG